MKNSYKYAKTLFDICLKTDKVTTLKKEFEVIAYLYKKVSTFRLILITKKHFQKDNDFDSKSIGYQAAK